MDCQIDYEVCEKLSTNLIKVKSKKDLQFYYIKQYKGLQLEKEQIEYIKNKMKEISDISNLKVFDLIEEDNNIYLIFEYTNGRFFCPQKYFQEYHIWIIAEKLLEIFEKLSKKGILFNKNNDIDVFVEGLYDLKINCFDLIKNTKMKDINENNEILFNLGVILKKKSQKSNKYLNGFINDLMYNKIDILITRKIIKYFLKYSLSSDIENYDVIYYNKMIYSGQLKGEKPDGKGMIFNEFNLVYSGEFKDGLFNGKGKCYLYKENNYNREIKIKQNYGNLFGSPKKSNTYSPIRWFEGNFINGEKNGHCIEYEGDIKVFEGEFQNGTKNGNGKEYYHNSYTIKYKGEFKDGKRNGKGKLYNSDMKLIYDGNFINDLFNGFGILYYFKDNKIHYKGNFKNGLFSGKGIYYNNKGSSYEVIDGFPINSKLIKGFKILNGDGEIKYEIEKKENQIIKGIEYSYGRKIYDGQFKLKEQDNLNLEEIKNNQEYENISLIREGFGKKTDYDYYEGEFLNGKYHGKGKQFDKDTKKLIYEGEYYNGVINGKGIRYYDKEYKEEGIFKDGILITGYKKNEYFEGFIVDGLKEGKGKIYFDNKLRFEGNFHRDIFVNGKVYDKNKKLFFDGNITEDNKISGKFYYDQKVFEGKFEDFCKITSYIIDFTNKCTINYEGEYKNGMKSGKGFDSYYEGEYLYGEYHGIGKNGDNKGEYKNGKKFGYWKEYDFEGWYKNGLRNGEGTLDSWKGEFVDNNRHGKFQNKNEIKYYCFDKESLMEIVGDSIYFDDFLEYQGEMQNGLKHGFGIEFYKNGNKRYEGSFKNGKKHGKGVEFYSNGNKKYEGEYYLGNYHKSGKEYDEKENLIYEGEFENGNYSGKGKLYRDGILMYEGNFVNNKLKGKGKEYNKKKELVYEGEFDNNAYNGKGIKYIPEVYNGYWKNNKLKN